MKTTFRRIAGLHSAAIKKRSRVQLGDPTNSSKGTKDEL
jgi:hypothetical protein